MRWSPPEVLDAEEFAFKWGGPTKMGDIYSMGMTIYEVSFLRYESGRSIEVVLGSNGQATVSQTQRSNDGGPRPWRRTPRETNLRHYPRLYQGPVGSDDTLLGGDPW